MLFEFGSAPFGFGQGLQGSRPPPEDLGFRKEVEIVRQRRPGVVLHNRATSLPRIPCAPVVGALASNPATIPGQARPFLVLRPLDPIFLASIRRRCVPGHRPCPELRIPPPGGRGPRPTKRPGPLLPLREPSVPSCPTKFPSVGFVRPSGADRPPVAGRVHSVRTRTHRASESGGVQRTGATLS